MVQTENSEPILATGGYDHTIKIWQPYSGTSIKTLQHTDSQVNVKIIKKNQKIIRTSSKIPFLGKRPCNKKLPRRWWLPKHPPLRPQLQHKSPHQLRRHQQECHSRRLPRRWSLPLHRQRRLSSSHLGLKLPATSLQANV